MKYYNLIKLNRFIKSHRIKFLGLYGLHLLGRRYLAVHLDPVNACNLRCKMCYFTDKDYVKKLKGIIPPEEIAFLGNSFFKRAVKLQIGCGTEPTLYKELGKIIKEAKKHEVPYVSITTNANLIKEEELRDWAASGLSEITVSLHGVTKETYENMMQKGDFDKFLNVLKLISKVKEKHELKLRINYTFNEDNFEELSSFYEVFDEVDIDILQIRPIVKIGNTEYNNFSLEKVIPVYDEVQKGLLAESQKRGVTLLSHKPKKLKNRVSLDSVIKKYVYCYISPTSLFRKDFKWGDETYNQYARRRGIPGRILKDALKSKKTILNYADDKLNYDIN